LTPGCNLDILRSNILRIYLDIHIHALGIEFSPIVEAQAEYGERKLIININSVMVQASDHS
jgi:hypothetical protein